MDSITASDLSQASAFYKGYNGKCLKGFFYHFDLPLVCANVLLEYLFNLVMLYYMLLIMVYIVYDDAFVGGAVYFN